MELLVLMRPLAIVRFTDELMYGINEIVRVIKSRRIRWAGHVARVRVRRGVYRVLVRKPEGKRPLGRPRLKLEDNIRMDLQEVGYGLDRAGSVIGTGGGHW